MNADLDTYYGHIASHWKHEGGHLTLDVSIPVNTTATIYIPATGEAAIRESGQPLSAHPEIKVIGHENNHTVIEAGSGNYHFQTN